MDTTIHGLDFATVIRPLSAFATPTRWAHWPYRQQRTDAAEGTQRILILLIGVNGRKAGQWGRRERNRDCSTNSISTSEGPHSAINIFVTAGRADLATRRRSRTTSTRTQSA